VPELETISAYFCFVVSDSTLIIASVGIPFSVIFPLTSATAGLRPITPGLTLKIPCSPCPPYFPEE